MRGEAWLEAGASDDFCQGGSSVFRHIDQEGILAFDKEKAADPLGWLAG